jgi:hypothetical protein
MPTERDQNATDHHSEIARLNGELRLAARNEAPRIKFHGRTELWIVTHTADASSWAVWRGERTTRALQRELDRERRAGRRALIELETAHCSPTEMSLGELVALGIVEVAS